MRVAKHLCLLCLLAAISVTAAQTQSSSQPLTNVDVIGLVNSGLDEDLVMQKIRTAPAKNFDTSADGLKALNDAKVPTEVIQFMITGKEIVPGDAEAAPFKEGLWETHTVTIVTASGTMPPGMTFKGNAEIDPTPQKMEQTIQTCRDNSMSLTATANFMANSSGKAGCSHAVTHPDTKTVVVFVKCAQIGRNDIVIAKDSGITMTIQQVDVEHMTVDTKIISRGIAAGKAFSMEEVRTGASTYKGPCPPDMHPGEIKMPDGTIRPMGPQTPH